MFCDELAYGIVGFPVVGIGELPVATFFYCV